MLHSDDVTLAHLFSVTFSFGIDYSGKSDSYGCRLGKEISDQMFATLDYFITEEHLPLSDEPDGWMECIYSFRKTTRLSSCHSVTVYTSHTHPPDSMFVCCVSKEVLIKSLMHLLEKEDGAIMFLTEVPFFYK